MPGAGECTCSAAWASSAVCSSATRETMSRTWSRRYSRRSVATWSLRLRPARSLPPSEPTRSSRPRSSAVCTSSSVAAGRNSPLRQARERLSRAASSRASSSSSSSPAWCSTRACARGGEQVVGREPPVELDADRQPRERLGRPGLEPASPQPRRLAFLLCHRVPLSGRCSQPPAGGHGGAHCQLTRLRRTAVREPGGGQARRGSGRPVTSPPGAPASPRSCWAGPTARRTPWPATGRRCRPYRRWPARSHTATPGCAGR